MFYKVKIFTQTVNLVTKLVPNLLLRWEANGKPEKTWRERALTSEGRATD